MNLHLQLSFWVMGVCASRLGEAALASHHVAMLLWMLMSYIVDGFADLSMIYGCAMLARGSHKAFRYPAIAFRHEDWHSPT